MTGPGGSGAPFEVRRYGDRGWLVDTDDPVAVAARLELAAWPVRVEIVVGACSCLLAFDGPAPPLEHVRAVLAGPGRPLDPSPPHRHRIGVHYDGPDLAAVAAAAGLSVEAVVALHSGAQYRVAFLGFAPGFAYLAGLPPALQLPRRTVPRVRVPQGAVAVADAWSAIYPTSSPGGWHLLGSTTVRLFDAEAATDGPSLLQPGDEVRFVPVGPGGPTRPGADPGGVR